MMIRKPAFCFAALACVFPLLLVLVWTGPFGLGFIGTPIILGVWFLAALVALCCAIGAAIYGAWREAGFFLILPLASLVAYLNAGAIWGFAIGTGETIHFHVMRPTYQREVAQLPQGSEPRFAVWHWGGFVIGHGVVYDESDEILLKEASEAWKNRVAGTEIGACGAGGISMGNHFYLVRIGC